MKTNLRLYVLAVFALIAGLSIVACNRKDGVEAAREGTADMVLTPAEKEFLAKAEALHVKERNLSLVAQQKTMNEDVKDYAEMLVDDHNDALDRTIELMGRHGVPHSPVLDEAVRESLQRLSQLSGPALDTEFINLVVDGHRKALDKYREQLGTAKHPDIRDYAEDLTPVIEKHLNEAKELQQKLSSSQTN